MAIGWDKSSFFRAWPVYAVCAVLVGLVIWGSRNHPSRHQGKSLAEAIALNIRGQKAGELTMQDIIDARRTWEPVLLEWYGRRAGEWEFRDIGGELHRLGDGRGRGVVLLFWATWSPGSFMQAQHLERLREEMGESVVIVGFSEEAWEKLSEFAVSQGLNYTMVSLGEAPPAPFCAPWVRESPTTFFIDDEGRIKLAVEGVVPFFQAKAIFEAKE